MSNVELDIIALANSESSKGNFALILEEQNGFRRLPIIIGPFEAQSIAICLEKMKVTRPLTHDLFKNTLDALNAELQHVIIGKIEDGVFFATLHFKKEDGGHLDIDARSSDAIAMAVRCGCPIYTSEQILNSQGIMLDGPSKSFSTKRGSLTDYSLEELEKMLALVLQKEDFESAVKIRNAIAEKDQEKD